MLSLSLLQKVYTGNHLDGNLIAVSCCVNKAFFKKLSFINPYFNFKFLHSIDRSFGKRLGYLIKGHGDLTFVDLQ